MLLCPTLLTLSRGVHANLKLEISWKLVVQIGSACSKWFKMIQLSIPIGSNQHQSALPWGFRFTLTLRLRLVVPMPQVTSQRSQRPQSSLYRRKQHLFRFEHKFQWIPTNTDQVSKDVIEFWDDLSDSGIIPVTWNPTCYSLARDTASSTTVEPT